ncbi:MAG TPA: hypothetical protein VM492_13320 [Sumerlaeia bacterium]|nr:hypothetical protein [Sumerlaeia bacterium]
MKERERNKAEECEKRPSHWEYSHTQEFLDNLPYVLMIGLGAIVLGMGLGESPWAWGAATLYAAYGVAGAFWIIVFVCPYCNHYGTRACPCGYGRIAARLRPRRDAARFAEKFRKHIPAIVPLWIIPVAAGGAFLVRDFSFALLVTLVLFAVDAFVALPLMSKLYGCAHCPQIHECPWMQKTARDER